MSRQSKQRKLNNTIVAIQTFTFVYVETRVYQRQETTQNLFCRLISKPAEKEAFQK